MQIVNAYQNERKPIDELLKTPTRELFENSKYKPRRKNERNKYYDRCYARRKPCADKLHWSAPDGGISQSKKLTLFFLSTWDKERRNRSELILWSKEMPVDQMRVFVHQTLVDS